MECLDRVAVWLVDPKRSLSPALHQVFPVGTPIAGRPPKIDPSEPNSTNRLPPRVFDDEAFAGCLTRFSAWENLSRVAQDRKTNGTRRSPTRNFRSRPVDVSKIDPKYFRQTARYDSKEAPGTIIIEPAN
jgi:hypothetical protein